MKRIHCPCTKCKGRVQYSLATVKDHLIQNGREPTYRLWRGLGDRYSSDEEWEQEFKRPPRTHEDGKLDADLDVRLMVQDAFQEIDERPHPLEEIMEEIVMDAFTVVDDLQDGGKDDSSDKNNEEPLGDVCVERDMDDPYELEDAIQELYEDVKSSILAATILIMTLCTIHEVNNKFADQLFALFNLHLLPGKNRLPKNYYVAKSMIRKLGLNYNTIHACEGGCVLFRWTYENDVCCPKCNKARYKDKEKKKNLGKSLDISP